MSVFNSQAFIVFISQIINYNTEHKLSVPQDESIYSEQSTHFFKSSNISPQGTQDTEHVPTVNA